MRKGLKDTIVNHTWKAIEHRYTRLSMLLRFTWNKSTWPFNITFILNMSFKITNAIPKMFPKTKIRNIQPVQRILYFLHCLSSLSRRYFSWTERYKLRFPWIWLKESNFFHKLWFSHLFVFATQCQRYFKLLHSVEK